MSYLQDALIKIQPLKVMKTVEMDLSKLPIKVFDKNVVGSKISEKEMKRDIKLYLDTDAMLSKKSIMKIKLMKINN